MAGLRLLGINMIDKRLRQAFPSASYDAVFGGLSIILLGDFSQLHPVFDKPLYHNAEGGLSEMEAFGLVAYCLAATPVGTPRERGISSRLTIPSPNTTPHS